QVREDQPAPRIGAAPHSIPLGRRAPVNRYGNAARTRLRNRRSEMRVVGLALAGIFAVAPPVAANGPASNLRATDRGTASSIVLVWDGGGSGGHSGAIGGRPATGHARHWNGGARSAHRGQSRQYGAGGFYGRAPVPTYWLWAPGSAVFDYPFADWRG